MEKLNQNSNAELDVGFDVDSAVPVEADADAEKTVVLTDNISGSAGVSSDAGNASEPENLLTSLPEKSQDRYKSIRSVGFGGMKIVLLVHDRDTGRDVVKAIPDFQHRSVRDLNRFVREAQVTAKLEHPNIVPVYDIGIDDFGSPYFIMKYLRGSSLSLVLKRLRANDEATREKFPQTRLLQLFLRVCNAVAFAHSKGIYHSDLKPGNIHCGDYGEVQVIDWGLAGDILTDQGGQIIATPGYVAPELISGRGKPGKASDIYALGGILYAILTLDSPLAGHPKPEVLRMTEAGDIPPPVIEGAHLPPGLEAVCMKAMAFDPADRYQDAMDLRADINALLSGYASSAESPSAIRNISLFLRRNIYIVIIVILLILSGVLAYLTWYLYHN